MKYLDCYIRVSTQEQATDGNSLSVQIKTGKAIAKKLGLKFRLRDEGARSSTIHYRDVFEQMKDDIKEGKVTHIWVLDRSRMFRDMIDSMMFRKDYLVAYKVNLYEGVYASKVEFRDENEMLTYDILSRLQEYENKLRSERSQRGKVDKLKNAVASKKSVYLGGTATFGYLNQNKEWHINKFEEKWVKYMFQAYEDGSNLKKIKLKLESEGVGTRRTRNNMWNIGTLQKMLRNKTYTGIHSVHVKNLARTFSFKVPKIISVSQFNRVQKRLDYNKVMEGKNKKVETLLGEFLECECGTKVGFEVKNLTKKDGTKINTRKYYCLNKNYEWRDGIDRGCVNKKTLNMDETDKAILKRVKEVVSDSHILKERTKKEVLDRKYQIEENIIGERERLEDKCQRIQKTIDSIENQIVDLEVDMGMGKKDKSIAQRIINRYEKELEIQHDEYKNAETELEQLNEDLVWSNWVEQFSENLDTSTKTFAKKKDFLRGMISKIIVHSEIGLNRSEKEVQTGHSFDIEFKMKIVKDKLIWNDESDKRKGYNLKDGKNSLKTELIQEVTAKAGRVWSKKKQ
jgi:site-specific DNA recombinase